MDIIFDLDDTLANTHPIAQEYIVKPRAQGVKIDWDRFFLESCAADPIVPTAMIYTSLMNQGTHNIEVWTGRSDKVEAETIAWFEHWKLPLPHNLIMRPGRMRIDDDMLKQTWLHKFLNEHGKYPDLVLDDRTRVVEMYRRHDILVYQTANGNF